MNLPDGRIAREGYFATYFFSVGDQDKSKDFYVGILGGKLIKPDNPCYIKLANAWIMLNSGGGPTPDKPEVLLRDPDGYLVEVGQYTEIARRLLQQRRLIWQTINSRRFEASPCA